MSAAKAGGTSRFRGEVLTDEATPHKLINVMLIHSGGVRHMGAHQGRVPRTGAELRSWRLESGILQADLARKLNLTKRPIGNWEQRGDDELPPRAVRRLAAIIGPGSSDLHRDRLRDAEQLLTAAMEGRDPMEVVAEQLRAIGLLLLDNRERGMVSIHQALID